MARMSTRTLNAFLHDATFRRELATRLADAWVEADRRRDAEERAESLAWQATIQKDPADQLLQADKLALESTARGQDLLRQLRAGEDVTAAIGEFLALRRELGL